REQVRWKENYLMRSLEELPLEKRASEMERKLSNEVIRRITFRILICIIINEKESIFLKNALFF
ncbi:hypothetical protein, partial [Bacillus gaemokensis]|uniref:hypothetical protein n=1 Tax=Bacillus gaemokensis TaxID=574375 RepID=UPI001F417800